MSMQDDDDDNIAAGPEGLNATKGLDPVALEPRPKLSVKKERKLLESFKKKHLRWQTFENDFLRAFNDDIRFAAGDADNMWQWDEAMREVEDDKPRLTANMVRNHIALVTNGFRRNPPSMTIKPTGLGATGESAKVIGGVFREIARVSNMTGIVVRAGGYLVKGGVGYWRVMNEYENERSMEQVLRVRSIADMTAAGLDPAAKEPDGSDANWGFVYEDVDNDELEELHPEVPEDEEGAANAVLAGDWGGQSWRYKDRTRVAEWYEREAYDDILVGFLGEDGTEQTQFRSKIPVEMFEALRRERTTRMRRVLRRRVMWYKIVGDRIVDHRPVPGSFIPLIRVTGEEVVVEGDLDRKGLTRNLKDPQRNLNYWISSATEQVALQTKIPYIGPKRAFENNPQWSNANSENYAYLPFNDWDEENNRQIAAPSRGVQPQMADAYIKGLTIAEQQLKDISGQHENTEGKEDNAISGRAILARKQSGDVATYHFPDALAAGVAHTARVILSMFPEVYDTPRMIRISNLDGTQSDVHIDPAMSEALKTAPDQEGEQGDTKTMLNPSVGTYDVEATSGPDFETQRQWAVEAMTQLLASNEKLWGVVGDLFVTNMDFPGAAEFAERLKRTIDPAVLGTGPTPAEQKLQADMQQLQKLLATMVQTNSELMQKLENKDDENTVRAFDAETKRIKEIGNAAENFKEIGMEAPFQALAGETLGNTVDDPDVTELAESADAENDPPHPEAQRGEDGGYYVDHPELGRLQHVPPEVS